MRDSGGRTSQDLTRVRHCWVLLFGELGFQFSFGGGLDCWLVGEGGGRADEGEDVEGEGAVFGFWGEGGFVVGHYCLVCMYVCMYVCTFSDNNIATSTLSYKIIFIFKL